MDGCNDVVDGKRIELLKRFLVHVPADAEKPIENAGGSKNRIWNGPSGYCYSKRWGRMRILMMESKHEEVVPCNFQDL